jgi:glyoxylase-like metal-dependent hydrolase (beta-lactamase superfamily II)
LGVPYVCATYGIPFALHGGDGFLVDSCVEHGKLYGFQVAEKPVIERDLAGQEEVRFGDSMLRIIETPGHTPGHVCFWNPEERVLFTGDTLFKESIGRTDLPGGDYSWIMRSILDRLMPLGGDVEFHPGHGQQSTLGHEALYNPFITEVLNNDVNYK